MQALRVAAPRPPLRPGVSQKRRVLAAPAAALTIPTYATPEAGAFALLVGITAIFNQYCAVKVVQARRTWNVPYPKMYQEGDSDAAFAFNSVQRAHQNTLEVFPFVALMTAAIASAAPRFALGLYAVWLFGRILYMAGYSKNGPKGRLPGAAISSLASLVGMLCTVVWGAKTLLG